MVPSILSQRVLIYIMEPVLALAGVLVASPYSVPGLQNGDASLPQGVTRHVEETAMNLLLRERGLYREFVRRLARTFNDVELFTLHVSADTDLPAAVVARKAHAGVDFALRANPSGGALQPLEAYILGRSKGFPRMGYLVPATPLSPTLSSGN